MICVANEKPTIGLFTLLAFLGLTHWLTDFNIIDFFKNYTKEIVIGGALYFPIGIGWSYFRWYFKLKDVKRKLLDTKEKVTQQNIRDACRSWIQANSEMDYNSIRIMSENELVKYVDPRSEEIQKIVEENWANHVKSSRPLASDHITQITNWISWWPFSMFWTLVDDFFVWVGQQLYNFVAGHFQRMSDKEFKDI